MMIVRAVLLCCTLVASLALADEATLHAPLKRDVPMLPPLKLVGDYGSAVVLLPTGHATRVTEEGRHHSGTWRFEGHDIVVASAERGVWDETIVDVWVSTEGFFSHRIGAIQVRDVTTDRGERVGATLGIIRGNKDGRLFEQFLAWPVRALAVYFDEGHASVQRSVSEIFFNPDEHGFRESGEDLARELAPVLGDITPRAWPTAEMPYDVMVVIGKDKAPTRMPPLRVKLMFSGKRTAEVETAKRAIEKRGFLVTAVEKTKTLRTKPEIWFTTPGSRSLAYNLAAELFSGVELEVAEWKWGGKQDVVVVMPQTTP